MITVKRSDLTGAPYNPRVIGETEKRKLRRGLKKHGMVSPITWNKRTGRIVGGHQRIEQLDALAGSQNYSLSVAAIDVDETKEKEINLLLNNPEAQGDWNLDGLKDVLKSGLELEGAGFERDDLFRLFGEDILAVQRQEEELDQLADKVRNFSKMYDELEKANTDRASTDFYLVVVFRNEPEREKFLTDAGLLSNRYQSGDDLRRMLIHGNMQFSEEDLADWRARADTAQMTLLQWIRYQCSSKQPTPGSKKPNQGK